MLTYQPLERMSNKLIINNAIFTARNSSCGKVIFSQVSVNLFTDGGEGGRVSVVIDPRFHVLLVEVRYHEPVHNIMFTKCLYLVMIIKSPLNLLNPAL